MTKLGKYEVNDNHPLKNTNGITSDIIILTSSFIYYVLCEFLNLLRSTRSHHGDDSSRHVLKKPFTLTPMDILNRRETDTMVEVWEYHWNTNALKV